MSRAFLRLLGLVLLAPLAFRDPARSGPAAPDREGEEVPAASEGVTRMDLARVLQGIERDQLGHPEVPAELLTQLGRELDACAWSFFNGDLRAAGERMGELRRRVVSPLSRHRGASPRLTSVRMWADSRGGPEPPVLHLRSTWAAPGPPAGTADAHLEVRSADGLRRLQLVPLELTFDEEGRLVPQDLQAPPPPPEESGCSYELVQPGGHYRHARWEWVVCERPLEELASDLLAELDGLELPEPLADAGRSLRARLELLARPLDPDHSASFLARPALLLPSLHNELSALRQGVDPYRLRPGSTWRTFRHGTRDLPLWVHAPPALNGERSLPLLIALHGAGGDELYFDELGGDGLLGQVADAQGFLVAAPFTPDLLYDFGAFDDLLADLCARYPVDRERVYVLGHSLGAMTAETLCRVRGEALAGAVCIAGGRRPGGTVPVHYLAGTDDGVFPADDLRRRAERAKADGVPTTFEELPGGHILVLPAALYRSLQLLGLVP